jgi:hypothetical protein
MSLSILISMLSTHYINKFITWALIRETWALIRETWALIRETWALIRFLFCESPINKGLTGDFFSIKINKDLQRSLKGPSSLKIGRPF